MSASDAAPLPRLGEVFFDVRGSSRSMRLSWYSDTGVAVFSIWQGGTCTGTFRLPIDDLPRMVEALQRGPRGAALPAGEARDQERGLGAERQRRGITAAPTEAMPAVASFSDYATGQLAPVTGEFRPMTGPAEPTYRDDPLGSGAYPAYRDRDQGSRDRGSRDRGQDSPGGSFPGYADDGPPVYRDSSPPPGYGDDPVGARSYRDEPPGSGGYPAYREASRAAETTGNGSLPGHRDSAPYRNDPPGSGAYPAYRDRDQGSRDRGSRDRGQDSPGGSFPGYADDGPPVYRDSSPPPGYGDDPVGARSYRDEPPGSGGYPAYREASRAAETTGNGSLPGHRDSAPYRNDPPGSGYRSERPSPSYRDDPYPPSYRNEPAPYPVEAPYPAEAPGQRYNDDPFQSVYPEDSREPGYPEDERAGSHPYGPPGRTEPRVPRGRS